MPIQSQPPLRPQSSRSSARKLSLPASLSLPESEVYINVYDLLPPGKLSTTLWALSMPLAHTSLHIPSLDLELAYGGHERPNKTGVYTVAPHTCPPGARHRATIRLGTTMQQPWEMTETIASASSFFLGTEYHVLTRNCNHFCDYLARRLVDRGIPGWCNRAAKVGVALPCLVPAEWVAPPGVETAEGRLVEDIGEVGEGTALVNREEDAGRRRRVGGGKKGGRREQVVEVRDEDGRVLPVAERAPVTA